MTMIRTDLEALVNEQLLDLAREIVKAEREDNGSDRTGNRLGHWVNQYGHAAGVHPGEGQRILDEARERVAWGDRLDAAEEALNQARQVVNYLEKVRAETLRQEP